jgi:hypothetical protein
MKASERRLIAILCVLAAISGGAIMSQMLLRKQSSLGRRQQTLELKRMEAEAMLSEAALWKAGQPGVAGRGAGGSGKAEPHGAEEAVARGDPDLFLS